MVERDARADQQDQPADIQPHHEEDHDRKARVDRRVLGRSGDGGREHDAHELPENAGHERSHER